MNSVSGMLEELADKQEAVGLRLEAVRKVFALTKKQFAARAGLSEQVYGPFENGRRPLTLDAAKKIRRVYKVPLDFMYFGSTSELPARIFTALTSSPSVKSTQKSNGKPD